MRVLFCSLPDEPDACGLVIGEDGFVCPDGVLPGRLTREGGSIQVLACPDDDTPLHRSGGGGIDLCPPDADTLAVCAQYEDLIARGNGRVDRDDAGRKYACPLVADGRDCAIVDHDPAPGWPHVCRRRPPRQGFPAPLSRQVSDGTHDGAAKDDLVHPVHRRNLVQERDMPFRYQRRPEVIAEYPVDPLDVVGEGGARVPRRCDGYRTGLAAAGADAG